MKEEPNIQKLQGVRRALLESLSLPEMTEAGNLPDFLKRQEPAYIRKLLDSEDLAWARSPIHSEAVAFANALRRTAEGQKLCTLFDIKLLRQVKETGTDQTLQGPCGMIEMIFPVKVRGQIIHCLWSGKMRDHPFTDEEKAEAQRISGISKTEMDELCSSIPILDGAQIKNAVAMIDRLRNTLEQVFLYYASASELQQQLLESERANSLGTLSGGIAHHFNNLLSVILGYATLVLDGSRLSKEAIEALHKVVDAAQRGRRLTEEIAAFLGGEKEEVAPCRLHATITSVLSLMESKIGAGVSVNTRLEATNDIVSAPPSSIHQIVFNLLTNSIESLQAGGRLEIITTNTDVETATGKQKMLQFEVADSSGAALVGARSPAAADELSLKLSSVYRMVGRIAGTVVVTPNAEGMTRIKVLLPAYTSPDQVEQKTVHKKKPVASRIWVVDDDATFREMCRQVLTDAGHTVEDIAGGREMRERWTSRSLKPDLIILDFSMPEYNGLQLCEWLKEEGSLAPVILVSGFASNQPDIRKALRMRKTYFLQKPFSFREMLDTITVALGETFIGE